MEKRDDILNELQTISPLLAGFDKVNVFTVPQSYFDSILPTVLACINEDENTRAASIDTEKLQKVPEGYFTTLANTILDKIKQPESVQEELSTLSPTLAAVGNKNVFEVPQGYFNSTEQDVFNKIKQETVKKELEKLSPVLAAISKENMYIVPQGYFENLQEIIVQKIQPAAKVVYLQRRSSFIKYAAAAIVTGALALGVYKYADKPAGHVEIAATQTVKPVPVVSLDPSIEKGKSMDEKQFAESLNKLSEEEITQYLEKNGDEADMAALTSTVEGTSLPSQDDYLLNEKTLDNYIRNIESTQQNN